MAINYFVTGDITNKAIQDNVDELFEELRPAIEKVVSSIVDDMIFKTVEENIPFDKLFPNIP